MANVGDIEQKYRRNYVAVNPQPDAGPITWRLAAPQEVGVFAGGSAGAVFDFEAEVPVVVDTVPSEETGRSTVTTSLDIQQLDDRAD